MADFHPIVIPLGPGRARSATGPSSVVSPTAANMNPLWAPSPKALKHFQEIAQPEGNDVESIEKSFCRHATKTIARGAFNMDNFAAYQSLAYS